MLQLANLGFTLITSIVLARLLGVERYGTYTYSLTWMTVSTVFSSLGSNRVIIRNVAVYKQEMTWDKLRGLLVASFIGVLVVSLLTFVISCTVAYMLYGEKHALFMSILIAMLLGPLVSIISISGSFQQGLSNVLFGQIPNNLVRPAFYLLLILIVNYLILTQADTQSMLMLYIVASLTATAVSLWMLKSTLPTEIRSIRPSYEISNWLRSSLPLLVMAVMNMVNSRADTLLLGIIRGPAEVGLYQVANRGSSFIPIVLTAIIAPLTPLVAKLYYQQEISQLQRIVTKSARLAFGVALVIGLTLIVGGRWFLQLFGSDFVSSYGTLVILCIGQILNVAAGPVAMVLIMTGYEKEAAIGLGVSAVVNIVFNVLFINLWGAIGAAVATSLSITCWNVILIWYVWQRIRINPTAL